MRAALVHDQPRQWRLLELVRFLDRVYSGVRGVAGDGSVAAFDVRGRDGRSRLVVAWVYPPVQGGRSHTVLMLQIDPDLSYTRAGDGFAIFERFPGLLTRP